MTAARKREPLRLPKAPGVAWEPRPRQRRPRVGEVWRTAAGSECVVLEAGKTTEPISARRVKIRIVVPRGAFIVGDVTTALVGDFIRRWALVEQKAVA